MSVKIIQGEDRDITVQLKDGNGANLDLANYVGGGAADMKACFISTGVAIEALFSNVAKPYIRVNGNNDCGSITISLTATETALLDTDGKDFEIDLIDAAGETRIVQVKGQLDISEQIC